jgi:lipid-A-disaccharide synthase
VSEHLNVVLVAGETSGDQLGAELISSLQRRYPQAEFFGVGGPLMADAGQQQWFAASELAVMGLFEVLRHLPRLLRRRREVIARTQALKQRSDSEGKPLKERRDSADQALGDLIFIGIDAPDFNLPIAKRLKAQGVCCVHYVSPSIWAWRAERAAKIGAAVDLVLCLFPFEPELYQRYGVAAKFVGHPLAERFPLEPTPMAARSSLGLPMQAIVLAVLPGSRVSEINALAKDFFDAAGLLKKQFPKLIAVAPIANEAARAAIEAIRADDHPIMLIEGQAQLVLQAADAVLVASGTAALEAMLARKPMLVAYRVHPVTYFLARTLGLLKTTFFSLPNRLGLMFGSELIVDELEQHNITPNAIAGKIGAKLRDGENPEVLEIFKRCHETLCISASEHAADAIVEVLKQRSVITNQTLSARGRA